MLIFFIIITFFAPPQTCRRMDGWYGAAFFLFFFNLLSLVLIFFFLSLKNLSIILVFLSSFVFFFLLKMSFFFFRGDNQLNASEPHRPFKNQLILRNFLTNLSLVPSFRPLTSQRHSNTPWIQINDNNCAAQNIYYQNRPIQNLQNHAMFWQPYSNRLHGQNYNISTQFHSGSINLFTNGIVACIKQNGHMIQNAIFGLIFYTILIYFYYISI